MKPNFDTMNIAELRAYLLSHRHDDEAFHKLVDRLEANDPDAPFYPMPDTPENITLMEAAIRERIQKLEEKREN